jgi:hypothetical protein
MKDTGLKPMMRCVGAPTSSNLAKMAAETCAT